MMIQKESKNENKYLNISLIAIFIALVFVTIVVRIRHLPTPLERDEGEYAYAGQLMLQGVPPYSLAYNMKMPGIYAAYAVILALFGQDQIGIHFGVLLINTATIILIFILAKKLYGLIPAVAAGCFFAIGSISSGFQATANAENFVVLPAMAAILILLKFTRTKKLLPLIISGLLFGIAFMMKQHGAAYILFGLFYIVFILYREKTGLKRIFYFVSIYSFFVALPFLITCLILWRCGVFEKFWYWTFDYARYYINLATGSNALMNLHGTFDKILPAIPLIWLLGLAGLFLLIFGKQFREHRAFTLAFAGFSLLSVFPGLYFRSHYFILFLPAYSMLAGLGVLGIPNLFKFIKRKKIVSIFLILIAWSQSFYAQREFLLAGNPELVSRLTFGFYSFPESLQIAKYIKAHSSKDDKIAVLGSEPQIYFYSQRRSATAFIYTYPLMELHPLAIEMQKEMISQIEANKPKYMVIFKTVDSWIPRKESAKLIFQWLDKYVAENYKQVGLVELFKDELRVQYSWTPDAKPQQPEGWIMILKRND
ncbi:MAG: glycosyltransferase family 39 protein [Phycisphaerales bacterium]